MDVKLGILSEEHTLRVFEKKVQRTILCLREMK
jgi:hypothetical protein